MEEILASIRRIISEDDGSPPNAAAADRDDDDEALESDEPEAASDDDDEEPVELTRMVDDTGQVVDLAAGAKGAAADEDESDAVSKAAKEEDDKVSSNQAAEKMEASETATSATGEDAVELVDKTDDGAAAVAPAPDDAASDDGESVEGLVSANTKKAAAASLAQVISAVAVPEPRPDPLGGERTLEAVVRDALQPELRGWLDQNLAPLVERIVREEIKKLVRRVEDR